MIPLPSWFDDELPPTTLSFVDVPGEGAHFLDSFDVRAAFEASGLALAIAPTAPAAPAAAAPDGHHSSLVSTGDSVASLLAAAAAALRRAAEASALSQLHSGRPHRSSMALLKALDAARAAPYRFGGAVSLVDPAVFAPPPPPSAPLLVQTPLQLAREKLRNPTGRPRGRPSILEKSLRDAAASRMRRLTAAGHAGFRAGAIPGQLDGRPLEELCARWRCMSCALPPDRTPLIRRGPEGMHSLCDACGHVYALTRRFRDVAVDEIDANMALACGPLRRPRDDGDYISGPDPAPVSACDGAQEPVPQYATTPTIEGRPLSS
ncbi:hypothetical protein H4R21_007049, partial [Coemansia helicoidea]